MLLPYTAGWSCGPILGIDEARFDLFRPNNAGSSPLEPFYYTEAFLNGGTPDPEGKDNARNCAEWQAITGTGVSAADIYTIQYTTAPDDFLRGYNTGQWEALEKNSFVQWLRQPAHQNAARYLALAKRAEWTQTESTDPWGEGRLPSADLQALAHEAEAGYYNEKDLFLKTRYAFQAVKMWYYAGYHTGAPDSPRLMRINTLYDSALLGRPTIVAGWAALYHGMVQKDSIAHVRSIVRAFDLSEEKKVFAFQQLSRDDLEALLRVETDPKLRLAAIAMKGANTVGPALDDLKVLAIADSQSKYLPLLAGREVAKIEDWLLSPEALGFESALRTNAFYQTRNWDGSHAYDTIYTYYANLRRSKDRAYAAELRNFLEAHAVRSGPHHTYLLLAAAHLYSIEGDFKNAQKILASIPEPTTRALKIQWLIDLAVAEMHLLNVRTPQAQKALLARISALEELGLRPYDRLSSWSDEHNDAKTETGDDLSEILLLLSRRFQKAGDVVRASLLYTKAGLTTNHYDSFSWDENDTSVSYASIAYLDRVGEPADVDSLVRFKRDMERSAFDAYLAPAHWAPDAFYHDLKGTMLFRKGRYREALAVFEAMPDDFWETTYAYRDYLPRTSIASVGTLQPGSSVAKVHPVTSKEALLREMVGVQDSIAIARTPSVKARWMLKWAHAQYNTSYYGKAWMLFNYGNSSRETGSGWYESEEHWAYFTGEPSQRYAARYYYLRDAIAAYRETLRLASRDKETAATALLMLAHCDALVHSEPKGKKPLPAGVYYAYQPRNGEEKYVSPYLTMLRKMYAGTALYQQASATCPDVAVD